MVDTGEESAVVRARQMYAEHEHEPFAAHVEITEYEGESMNRMSCGSDPFITHEEYSEEGGQRFAPKSLRPDRIIEIRSCV